MIGTLIPVLRRGVSEVVGVDASLGRAQPMAQRLAANAAQITEELLSTLRGLRLVSARIKSKEFL